MELTDKIAGIAGVGPKMAERLEKLGIKTFAELLFYFPRRYEDYTDITDIGSITGDVLGIKHNTDTRIHNTDCFTISGTISAIANRKTRRRGFTVTEAVVADSTGLLKVVWFNQAYLAKMLRVGSRLILNGRVAWDSFANAYVMESPARANMPKIVPIYGETPGISSYFINKLVGSVKSNISKIEEWLPTEILTKNEILGIREAILAIHFPPDSAHLEQARRRFAFDELFLIALRSQLAKVELEKERAPAIKADLNEIKKFIATLPFELTDDQKKALWQILQDMEKPVPMSRLLNGDVGSGKTIVAALAALAVERVGLKTLVMAPTEILANQHYETFKQVFGDKIKIGLITGSKKITNIQLPITIQHPTANDQLNIKNCKLNENWKLKIINCNVVIGTHALIQKSVDFDNVGLVVVDEQHRFGVKQRQALREITNNQETITIQHPTANDQLDNSHNTKYIPRNTQKMFPHFLSMTATPIPRTLHLALFGDLDLSIIRELPRGRKEIKTRFVEPMNRDKAYEFIGRQIEAGRQVFVICPLIEEKETVKTDLFEEDRKSVKAEFEKLKVVFPQFKIGMLHGKMKSAEKEAVMADFKDNKINLLVSTSVVEVGVDVPNASVMMIEDAERFGLAQIHQFRGRVGRAEHQSFCFLFSNSRSDKVLSRLRALETTADGFKLAEIDLETRGPGAVFGTEQSGMLDLKMATLSDRELIEQAGEAAKGIASKIENYSMLKAKINQFVSNKHLE